MENPVRCTLVDLYNPLSETCLTLPLAIAQTARSIVARASTCELAWLGLIATSRLVPAATMARDLSFTTVTFFTSASLHVVLEMRRDVVPVISLLQLSVVQYSRFSISRDIRSWQKLVLLGWVTAVGSV